MIAPAALRSVSPGRIHVLVHFKGAPGSAWVQRASFEKPGPYCLELSRSADQTEFHLFFGDEATSWIGAVNVRLAAVGK